MKTRVWTVIAGLVVCGAPAFGQMLTPVTGSAGNARPDFHAGDGGAADQSPMERALDPSRWAVDFGVAVISGSSTVRILRGEFNDADGDGGGFIYNLSATHTLKRFGWTVGGREFHPEIDLPFTLGIVDEKGRSPFTMYSAAVTLRWTDFPWNRYVSTTAAVGVGLMYASKVPAIDLKRHPGEDRSHIKFYLPLEVTLAHPGHPRAQLVLFNHHYSGGHIFDEGGFDSLGVAFRYRF